MSENCFHRDDLILVKEITGDEIDPFYVLEDLNPSTAYYLTITAFSEKGEGYKPKQPFILMTRPESFKATSKLYVWGSNTHSEIGLSEKQVAENKQHYQRAQNVAYLTKPIQHKDGFEDQVAAVACGSLISLMVYLDNNVQVVVQTGNSKVNRQENQDLNLVTESDLYKLEEINSMPFSLGFDIPVFSVHCGDSVAAILTCEGQVFTWGNN